MRWYGRRVIVGVGMLVALFATGSATAAEQPPQSKERAVAIASPGVVYIDTSFTVSVRIKLQDESASGTYSNVPYGSGSGLVVNPSGTILTARHVVKPDDQEVRNYASNKLFAGVDLFGDGKLVLNQGDNLYDRFTVSDDSAYNHRLQQCYDGVICTFHVTPIVHVYTGVALAGTTVSKGLTARILKTSEQGANNTDIAVLQIQAHNMPTTPLAVTADSASPGDQVVALGFPGTAQTDNATQPDQKFGSVSRVSTIGATKQVEVDVDIEEGMSGGPVVNLSGRTIGITSYYVARATGAPGTKYARSIDDARQLLSDAGKTPSRGPVDVAWQRAVDLYFEHHYSAAIPYFTQVTTLSPGHPLATEYLQKATALKGTKADVPLGGGGLPWWAFVLIAVGAVAVLTGIALFVWQRRGRAAQPAVAAPVRCRLPGGGRRSRTGDRFRSGPPPQVLPRRGPIRAGSPPAARPSGRDAGGRGRRPGRSALPGRGRALDRTGGGHRPRRRRDLAPSRRRAPARRLDRDPRRRLVERYLRQRRAHLRRAAPRSRRTPVELGQTTIKVWLPAVRKEVTAPPSGSMSVTLRGGPLAGRTVQIEHATTIGRESADLGASDEEVSRAHAVARLAIAGIQVTDLNSSNGTYLNGKRLEGDALARPGDEIRIGGTTLVVEGAAQGGKTVIRGATVVHSRPGGR